MSYLLVKSRERERERERLAEREGGGVIDREWRAGLPERERVGG